MTYNLNFLNPINPNLFPLIYYNEKKEKVLPLIFNNREYVLIIDGYIKADGHEQNNSFSITSTSKSLLLSIQAAAIVCGYSTKSIRPVTRNGKPIVIKGKEVKSVKPIWRMTICKESAKSWKQIFSVEYVGEETVYNIGVDGTHTYICDNYKVHNCVDLIKYYLDEVFGIKAGAWGDAYAYYTYFDSHEELTKNFTRIANTPSFIPQRGDIMVWSKNLNGKWGHIAVCDGDGDTTYFYSYDQNWLGQHDPCNRIKHNYNHVLGVLRPNDQTRIKGKEKKTMNVFSKGIDISRYQGNPDFAKVKKEVDYVIVQAGYGRYSSQKDSSFERNYSECKKYGIPVGVYWFSYANSVADAKKEAEVCLEIIKGKQFEYPIYFDIEGSALSGDVSGKCKAFCEAIEKAGYYAGIYISRSPAQTHLSKDVASKYALWLAEYSSKCNYSGDYGMWQYGDNGKISGISGAVDMDYCYVDYPTLIKKAGKNGYTKTPELPVLDKTGFKQGDKGYQALALKSLLKLAVDKGLVTGKLDSSTGLGGGSVKIINALLKKWKYQQNGIAGKNFINKLYKKLK